jgi:hypothetical protein
MRMDHGRKKVGRDRWGRSGQLVLDADVWMQSPARVGAAAAGDGAARK